MQGIAGILGGKGGGAGSGAPAGAAAEPPGRAQPVRAVPAGKGPLRGWVGGGRVYGGGLCVELVCAWGAAPAAGCAPAEGAGGQAWAGRAVKPPGVVGAGGGGPAGPPRPQGRPGRRAAPESRPEGGFPCGPWGEVCRERDGKAYHAPDGRQPGLQKIFTQFH